MIPVKDCQNMDPRTMSCEFGNEEFNIVTAIIHPLPWPGPGVAAKFASGTYTV
jgi:hypothetical protein